MSAETVLNKLNVITDLDPNFLNNITTPNRAYVATILKLQSTGSNQEDIFNLRLKRTTFNFTLAQLILDELGVTQPSNIPTRGDYIHIQFFSPSFIQSLNNFDLISLPSELHRHILRAIVELKFKISMKTATYSLQSTFQTNTIPQLITYITYATTKQQNNPISQLHIRTTPTSTCIRFKLNAKDTSLIDYLYPPLNPSTTLPYIHNQKMGEAITYFDSEY